MHIAHSRWRVFQEGLPQGSVLAPLMWLVYANDIDRDFPADTTTASLFSDDVAILAIGRSLQECADKLQPTLDKVEKWTTEWKVQPSPSKCTMSDPQESGGKKRPLLRFCGTPLKFEASPTFLGITLNG